MFWSRRYGARRTEVRKNRPDLGGGFYSDLKARGVVGSIGIAAVSASWVETKTLSFIEAVLKAN